MDSHLLFELTYVLYRICSTIIHGEHWLVEPSRKFCLFYPLCKGWLRNLAQRLFHNVSSYSFAIRAPAFPLVKMLFLIGEGFAWWSSRPLSVYSIFSRCMALSSYCSWDTWPFLWKPLPPMWMVCTLPSWWFSRSLSHSTLRNSSYWWTLADSAWCGLVWCGPDPAIINCYTILKHKLSL